MALPEVYDLDESGTPLEASRPTRSIPFSLHQIQVSKMIKNNYSLYLGINNLFNFIQTESPLVGYDDPNSNPDLVPILIPPMPMLRIMVSSFTSDSNGIWPKKRP